MKEKKKKYRGFLEIPYDPATGILEDNTKTQGMTYVELQAYFKSKGVILKGKGQTDDKS